MGWSKYRWDGSRYWIPELRYWLHLHSILSCHVPWRSSSNKTKFTVQCHVRRDSLLSSSCLYPSISPFCELRQNYENKVPISWVHVRQKTSYLILLVVGWKRESHDIALRNTSFRWRDDLQIQYSRWTGKHDLIQWIIAAYFQPLWQLLSTVFRLRCMSVFEIHLDELLTWLQVSCPLSSREQYLFFQDKYKACGEYSACYLRCVAMFLIRLHLLVYAMNKYAEKSSKSKYRSEIIDWPVTEITWHCFVQMACTFLLDIIWWSGPQYDWFLSCFCHVSCVYIFTSLCSFGIESDGRLGRLFRNLPLRPFERWLGMWMS